MRCVVNVLHICTFLLFGAVGKMNLRHTLRGTWYHKTTPCLKKNSQNCFCQNFVKFPPTLIIFGTKMAKTIEFCHVHWKWKMSAPYTFLLSWPSLWQKLSKLMEIWRSSDENNFDVFFETRCILYICVEPWLRRAPGAAGKSQSSVPIGCHDGSWQTDHYAGQAGQQRVPGEHYSCTEVLRPLQALWRTAVKTGRPHWLRLVLSSALVCWILAKGKA